MAKSITGGFNDTATREDQFGISDYTSGLADFIQTCVTPITISVQGTWGTGKTSFMQLVEDKLTEDVKCIWFNTWTYSQFNMGDQLAVSLLQCLIDEFEIPEEEKTEVKKYAAALKIWSIGKEVGLSLMDKTFGGRITGHFEDGLNALEGKNTDKKDEAQDMPEPALAIKKLKKSFEDCVQKLKNNSEKPIDRIVVFIDDLDRLEPKKAVELLEVLKVFFDCDDCVFVLAIDYDVVCKGVADKYGRFNENEQENERKGRSFFDKIIQVPFKMPTARYDISNYVKNCFKSIGIEGLKADELNDYVDLITNSIGNNPRAMKRLFNSYCLLTKVTKEELLAEDKNKKLLFAILCLQNANEATELVYDYIVSNRENKDFTASDFNDLISGNIQRIKDNPKLSVLEFSEIELEEYENCEDFWDSFIKAIDIEQGDGIIDKKEFTNFLNVVNFSTATAASSGNLKMRAKSCTKDDLIAKGLYNEDIINSFSEIIVDIVGLGNKRDIGPVFQETGNINLYTILSNNKQRAVLTGRLGKNNMNIQLYPRDAQEIKEKCPLFSDLKIYGGGYYNITYSDTSLSDSIKEYVKATLDSWH